MRQNLLAMPTSLLLFCGFAASLHAAAPRVGQTHDPAWGGHTMVVAGDGFLPGKTEFRIWSPQWDQIDRRRAERKSAPVPLSEEQLRQEDERLMACLGGPLPPLPAAPPGHSMACPVLKCSDRLAAIEFPRYTNYYSGPQQRYLAVLYVGDKDNGWSAPWVLNRTAAHFLTADEVVPGGSLRLIGRNLWTGGSPPLVALLDRQAGKKIQCPTRSRYYIHYNFSAYYDWEFTVPKETPAGSYELCAHDGTGEAYGWSGPLPLKVAAPVPDRRAVFDARSYGAVLNGVADDAIALQKALDEAGKQTPSIVVLPAGIAVLGKMLTIPPGVALRGQGMCNSILRSAPDAPLYTLMAGSRDFALEDLAVEGSGSHLVHLLSIGSRQGLSENVRLQRCRFASSDPDRRREIGIDRARRLSIVGCEFKDAGAYAAYTELSYIGHNRSDVTHWLCGGLGMGLGRVSQNCLVEHNRGVGPRGSGTVGSGCHYHTHFAGNIMERTLTADGEACLLEGAGVVWYGKPASPAPDRVKLPADSWISQQKPQEIPAWIDKYVKPYLSQYVVAITKGQGVGQYRRIASLQGDMMLLETPWGVPPDATSEAVLMHGSIECALVNNMTFNANGTAGGLFGAGGMNTILHGQVGIQSGALYVWSFVEPPEKGRSDGVKHRVVPDYFNQILACRMFDKGNVFLTDGVHGRFSTEDLEAIPQIGTLVAQNEIRYPKDYGWSASSFIDMASDVAQDQDNPDRGKFPAVVVSGRNVFPAIEENKVREADVGVWLGAQTTGGLVRRNTFIGVRYQRVKDLGKDSTIGPPTGKTEWHSYWGAGLNIELLPGRGGSD